MVTTADIERPINPHSRDLMFCNSCDFILDNSGSKNHDLYLCNDGYELSETSPITSPRGCLYEDMQGDTFFNTSLVNSNMKSNDNSLKAKKQSLKISCLTKTLFSDKQTEEE
jgi:hypothetical protein